ncbi:hypothetical protein J7I94_09365 [Streptomyces sp. ISL-12]|uniref:hypothetical protein n=1 Tax=Streptomyces sp. ISL-12 TaxID=2819177 RepID=UPI001BEA2CE2|nr:hypothetical protein [Streptomyces sp. ISL-12]MBT2410766.1 hypothetical protein [Streptomyces sp. ISL-12]
MSTPVHRVPTRQSSAIVTAVRQRQEQERNGGSSGNPVQRALLQMQSSAGNRAATAAVQRVRSSTLEAPPAETETPVPETPAAASETPAAASETPAAASATQTAGTGGAADKKKKRKRDWAKPLVDRYKKYAEQLDAWVKGVQTPTNAGVSQTATAAGDATAAHGSAASGVSAGSENLAAELGNAGLSTLDAALALEDAKKAGKGAKYHTAMKKAKVKGTDAAIATVNSGSYAAAIAREADKLREAANAAMSAEASGSLSAVVGTAKGARSTRRVTRAIRRYKDLKALGDPRTVHEASLAELREAVRVSKERVAAANAKVVAERTGPEPHEEDFAADFAEYFADFEALKLEMERAREAALALESAEAASVDVETLSSAQKYARKKTGYRIAKESVSGVGETTKAAAGAVGVAVAAGALASTPVGWGLAAGGGGLLLLLAGYKGVKAVRGRYNEKRHPELHGERDEDGQFPEAASEKEAWKHALAFWRKVENGPRQAKARDIYRLAAGPTLPENAGPAAKTQKDARDLLKVLKCGPGDHKLTDEAWENSLNDPDQKANWIKEITEQLASG